jgi:lipid II:glycine glycyltransferase (peptidoglycan interpeptide bridge formation enzyme)
MQIVKATPKELDALLAAKKLELPIEQSYVWQGFDQKVPGRKPLGVFFVCSSTGEVEAIAGLTLITQKGYSWVWIKHGPFFVAHKPKSTVVKETLTTLTAFVKKNHKEALFIRVTTPKVSLPLKRPIHHNMYDKTIIINITKSDEQLLAEMNRGGRYDLKKSLKANLEFKEIPSGIAAKEFDAYYAILEETASRDSFRANPKSTYVHMLNGLGDNVSLFAAYSEGSPVAWSIVTNYAGKGVYYYAAGNNKGRALCAAYGLQLFVMQSLRKKGCTSYDLMGVESTDYPSYASVTGFKKKFSSNVVDINKTYDIPLSPKYGAIKLAKKLKKVVQK